MSRSTTKVETIGQRLRRLRLERGLSQRLLSGPGVTGAYVSQIEADGRTPSMKALRVLAGKLGVTAEYLETGSDLGDAELRELRLAEAELRLRLEGEAPTDELQLILGEALASGDAASVERVQVALGLDAAGRGDHAEAICQLEAAVETGSVTPVLRPDVYAALGESYALAGEPGRAVELFELALSEIARLAPDDAPARVRFSTYLSYALTDVGELERAGDVVKDALRFVEQAPDPYMRVRLFWALARISHEQSKPLLALEYFRRAIALLETTEDTFHLARAHLSCAFAMLASGHDLSETQHQVELAEGLLGPNPEPRDIAVVHLLKAMYAVRICDYGTAESHARDSQRLTLNLPNQYGLATWALADSLAGQGDAQADETYQEATRLLQEHGTPREQIELESAYRTYLESHGADATAPGPEAQPSLVPSSGGQPLDPGPGRRTLAPRAGSATQRQTQSSAQQKLSPSERNDAVSAHDLGAAIHDSRAEIRVRTMNARDLAAKEKDSRSVEARELSEGSAAVKDELRLANASGRRQLAIARRQLAIARLTAAADRHAAAADRKQAAADLERAGLDELTDVYRRGTGRLALTQEIDRSRRSNQPLVMAMIDIDNLKTVNDTHGHQTGDALIRDVARAITSTLRSYDVTVRWGGDEFVCSLSDATVDVAAERVAQIQRVLQTYQPGASFSAGLAELTDDDDCDTLLTRADSALYRIKSERSTRVTRGG